MATYTKSQMTAIWRSALGIDTLRADMTLSRVDGIDTDTYITRQMRLWYLNLLDTAPVERLALTDISAEAKAATDGDTVRVTLPENCRRTVCIRLAGWQRAAAPLTGEAAAQTAARAASDYAAPGVCEPAVIAEGRTLVCMPASSPTVTSLMAVIDPGPELYVLDESLLATIPTTIDPYAL